MVCLGNICRSPLAHGLLEQKANALDLSWEVDSAGTSAYHVGHLPDKRSIDIAAEHGLDITHQRARQFVVEDFDQFDLIFAMDAQNFSHIKNMARSDDEVKKVHLILNETYPGENRRVPDPYYGGEQGFKKVFDLLDEAMDRLIGRLTETA